KEEKKKLLARAEELAERGEHVVAVAVQLAGEATAVISDMKGLQFVGMIGFQDPVKDHASQVVKTLMQNGIDVVILTGDQKRTAQSVVKKIGLQFHDSAYISGNELQNMNEEQLRAATQYAKVF